MKRSDDIRRHGTRGALRRARALPLGLVLLGLAWAAGGWMWTHFNPEQNTPDRWIRVLGSNPRDPDSLEALRAGGSGCLRAISHALRRRDSSLKRTLMGWDASLSFIDLGWVPARQWRMGALRAIEVLGPGALLVLPELKRSFLEHEPEAPGFQEAFLALGSNAIPVFVELLADRDIDERRAAFVLRLWGELLKSGQSHCSPEAAPVVISQLGMTEGALGPPGRVELAADLLGLMGEPEAVGPLLALGRSGDWRGRAAAWRALGRIGERPEEVVSALAGGLKDERMEPRREAARALAAFGPAAQGALVALGAASGDPEPAVALGALNCLRRLDLAELRVGPIVAALNSPHRMVRIAGARVLGEMPGASDETVIHLVRAVADEEPGVRVEAVRSLGRLGERAAGAIEPLARALPLDSEAVQITIIEALGRMGPEARKASPAIRLAWSNNQAALKRAASEALERIEGEGWDGQ